MKATVRHTLKVLSLMLGLGSGALFGTQSLDGLSVDRIKSRSHGFVRSASRKALTKKGVVFAAAAVFVAYGVATWSASNRDAAPPSSTRDPAASTYESQRNFLDVKLLEKFIDERSFFGSIKQIMLGSIIIGIGAHVNRAFTVMFDAVGFGVSSVGRWWANVGEDSGRYRQEMLNNALNLDTLARGLQGEHADRSDHAWVYYQKQIRALYSSLIGSLEQFLAVLVCEAQQSGKEVTAEHILSERSSVFTAEASLRLQLDAMLTSDHWFDQSGALEKALHQLLDAVLRLYQDCSAAVI